MADSATRAFAGELLEVGAYAPVAPRLELVSVHFSKAGGTSFSEALMSAYGEDFYLDYDHDPCNASHNISAPVVLPSHIRAVHGHFRADRYRDFKNAFLLTFLRDPIETLLSGYFFWLSMPPHGNPSHDWFITERPSLEDYARGGAGVAYGAYFGGFDINRFDFVGFFDRRERDMAVIGRMLGVSLNGAIHANKTPSSMNSARSEVRSDAALMGRLRTILAPDYEFYDKLRERWT